MSFNSRLSATPLGDLPHQFVVANSIEEFLQIKIHHPGVACGHILLRLRHRLMGRPSRPEPVAVFGERPVPPPLQNLHHRLLDESIQHRRDAKLSHPSGRLGDFHPFDRLRLVGPLQQLSPDGWPVLFQVVGECADGHPIDACTTLVGLHPSQCFLQVFSLTYFLHQSIGSSWAFEFMRRRERFGLFPSRLLGFTRGRGRKVQFELDILPLVVLEIHGLLTAPLVRAFSHRSRLGLSIAPPFGIRSASLALPTSWLVGSEEATLGRPRAGLRPPLKLHVRFSRMQLSRRLPRRRCDRRYQPYEVHQPQLTIKL